MRTASRLLLVPAILVTAIALAGCSLGGGAKHDSAGKDTKSASASDTSTDKATDDKTADAASSDGKSGCPAAITTALKSQSDGQAAEGTVADLAYPGDANLLDGACVITTTSSSGDSVMAFIPGDPAKAASIDAGLEAAGFTSLTKDDKSAFYTKDKESWVVATSATSNPVTSAFGDKFSGPLVTVMHIVTA